MIKVSPPKIEKWTLTRVEQLDSEVIFESLYKHGIKLNKNNIISEIKRVSSLKDLLDKWIQLYQLKNDRIDFIFFSIKVLAKRFLPEHLLMETLEDEIELGYELQDFDRSQTMIIWWKVWKQLQQFVAKFHFSSIQDFNDITNNKIKHSIPTWISDFENLLYDLSKKDTLANPMRAIVAEDFLRMLPNSEESYVDQMIIALGESTLLLGEIDEADKIFQDYINKYEEKTWVYIYWGDLYNPKMESACSDVEKATRLYKEAQKSKTSAIKQLAKERVNRLNNELKMNIY